MLHITVNIIVAVDIIYNIAINSLHQNLRDPTLADHFLNSILNTRKYLIVLYIYSLL